MVLSSDNIRSAYHGWLKKIPAVQAHPWLTAFGDLGLHWLLALKEGETCSWVMNAAQAPCSILLLFSAVASTKPGYFQVQSLLATAAAVAAAASAISMMLVRNTCFPSVVNERNFSMTAVVLGSVLHTGIGHLVFPVTMKYAPALALILWANTVGTIYIGYLNLVDTSGDRWGADPGLWVFLLIVVCAALTQLASVAARYYVTCLNMKAFFRHVIPKH